MCYPLNLLHCSFFKISYIKNVTEKCLFSNANKCNRFRTVKNYQTQEHIERFSSSVCSYSIVLVCHVQYCILCSIICSMFWSPLQTRHLTGFSVNKKFQYKSIFPQREKVEFLLWFCCGCFIFCLDSLHDIDAQKNTPVHSLSICL